MKKGLVFLFLLFFANRSYASEEVIMLNTNDINYLSVPSSPTLDYIYSRQNEVQCKNLDDEDIYYAEENTSENKALKTFYKFIDDKMINNKLNKFTSSMIDEMETDDY